MSAISVIQKSPSIDLGIVRGFDYVPYCARTIGAIMGMSNCIYCNELFDPQRGEGDHVLSANTLRSSSKTSNAFLC
jgi:hypothetical protein